MTEVPLGFLLNADFINFKYEDKRHVKNYSLPSREKQKNMFFIKNIDYDIIKAYSKGTPWSSSRKNHFAFLNATFQQGKFRLRYVRYAFFFFFLCTCCAV